MKNILLIGSVALLLFALSAGLSLYLTSLSKPTIPDEPAKGKEKEKEKDSKAKEKDSGEIPPPVVGETNAKATEDAALLLGRLRQRSEDLGRREQEAKKREQRLGIVMDDVRGERAVIDNLRKKLSAELTRLEDRQRGVQKNMRNLEEQKKAAEKLLADLKKKQVVLNKDERKNIGQLASISDSMEPDKAARVLKQMADSGELETAVKILSQMRERRAAAVLAELTDVKLAAQFMERLRVLKRPATSPGG